MNRESEKLMKWDMGNGKWKMEDGDMENGDTIYRVSLCLSLGLVGDVGS